LGLLLALTLVLKTTRRPSRMAQKALQALRLRYIELIRARPELMVSGEMALRRGAVLAAQDRLQLEQDKIDRSERVAGLFLAMGGTVAAAASLYLGVTLTHQGLIDAPLAAFGFFTALAMTEVLAPVHRGLSELGRMQDAARRIDGHMQQGNEPVTRAGAGVNLQANMPMLQLSSIGYSQFGRSILSGFSLSVQAGETVALKGPSGVGKSTALLLALGQLTPETGHVLLAGQHVASWTDTELFSLATMLPQRSVLMSGTILEALQLANPELDEQQAWQVLAHVQLDQVIRDRGGLESMLGEGGAGLSGGEQRRLALARVLLRKPHLLLLDEPTEGLDQATARLVLAGVRKALPQAAILMASHQSAEWEWADRVVRLG
jgi:ATP-binding cassette subfamily C protein CydC